MAEKRLIDANALLEKADWYEEYNEITGEEISFRYIAASDVEEAPTVDAVEVVRCKDCDYFTEHNDVRTGRPLGYGECHRYMGLLFRDEDFCSYGERKDNGTL